MNLRNIAINTKLTLLVLLLPIAVLAIVDIIGFYLHGTLVIEISNFLSSVLVFLLVWERLRESISKKMKYLHDTYLLEFYQFLKWRCTDTYVKGFFENSKEIRELREILNKYARFLMIKLYPAKLSKNLSEFSQKQEAIINKTQVFEEIGKRDLGSQFDLSTLLDYLGLEVSYSHSERELGNKYEAVAELIKKEHEELLDEYMNILNSLKILRQSMLQELEDFLKCNDLKIRDRASSFFG